MSDIQRQIEMLMTRARQIENDRARSFISGGDAISRTTTVLMSQVTERLRAMENLHNQFIHELEDLRTVVLRQCEELLDHEVSLRHEALKMAPELDHYEPAAIDPPVDPPKQISDGTGDQGMILELGETVERRKRKAAG